MLVGIKPENTRGDVLRSVLEGVAFNLDIILNVLKSLVDIREIVVVGGGAKNPVWCQIMADVFDMPVRLPVLIEEAGSMGAAVIGGVGAGLYDGFGEVERFLGIKKEYLPDHVSQKAYEPLKKLFDDCYYAMEGIFGRL